jgi:hypothetical protein
MPVTPTGLPAWTRTASIEQYGGHVDKENYLSLDAIDPLTDITAQGYARLTADVMAAALTSPFAVITMRESGGSVTVESAFMMPTGARLAPYAGASPPAGYPGVTRTATGRFVVGFATSYTDPYGVSGAFAARGAVATAGNSTFASANATLLGVVLGVETVQVDVLDAAGSGIDGRNVTLVVY